METKHTRWSFYNDRQVYLFMVWQEDWYAGEVVYARVLFSFLNLFELKQRHKQYLEWANRPYNFGKRNK